MKLLCLLLLSVFAFAVGSVQVVENEEVTVQSFEKNLHPVHLEFKSQDENVFAVEEQLSAAWSSPIGTYFLGDTIKNLLESFRETIINGNDLLPPLDPLEIDHLGPFVVKATGVKVTANINDLRAEGLQWYTVDKVNFQTLRLALGVHLTQPWLTVTGKYDAKARLALLITHTSGGNFKIFLNRFEVGVDLRLGTNLSAGHLLLRELAIKIDIADVNINIEGLVGSNVLNNIINNVVQGITQNVIQNQLGEISQTLSTELFDVINEVLKGFTLEDILG